MSIVSKEKQFVRRNTGLIIRVLGLIVIATVGYNLLKKDKTLSPKATAEFARTTVKITNLGETSGGTGVILASGKNESVILTNKHVCGLVENGAIVHTTTGIRAPVKLYKNYDYHDLCMIRVQANLGVNTRLAQNAPEMYSDAVISGHPHLLPHVVSKGNFSGYEFIQVMTGAEKCQDSDMQGPFAGMCMLFGIKPILVTYYAQLVTGLIMPGSSGSAIFNSDGEISALVFAGSEGLSYAFAVPYSAILDFISTEYYNRKGWKSADYSTKKTANASAEKLHTVVRGMKDVEKTLKEVYERHNPSK